MNKVILVTVSADDDDDFDPELDALYEVLNTSPCVLEYEVRDGGIG